MPDLHVLHAHLTHLDALLSDDFAARRRDGAEPGRARKERAERDLSDILMRHWRRTGREIRRRLELRGPHVRPPVMHFSVAEDYLMSDFGDEFWQQANQSLIAELLVFLLQAARDGIALFRESVGIGIDYSAANTEAAAWASGYTYDLVKGITETTRTALRQAITTFVNTPGVTVGDIVASLPLDEQRALVVATTETTRAYAQGNQAAGEQLAKEFPGVRVEKKWHTNNDDRVCFLCGPLNNVSVEINEKFIAGDGQEYDNPPIHPNDRCWTSTSTVMPEQG